MNKVVFVALKDGVIRTNGAICIEQCVQFLERRTVVLDYDIKTGRFFYNDNLVLNIPKLLCEYLQEVEE